MIDDVWSNLPGGQGAKRFSVLRINEALTSHAYLGQFDTLEEAQTYCATMAHRYQRFVTLQPVDNHKNRLKCGVQVRCGS